MKITLDTNVLVRLFVDDDPEQSALAVKTIDEADGVIIPTAALCELVWVLRKAYGLPTQKIIEMMTGLLDRSVKTDRMTVKAGLAMLAAGGDFADAVIAYEGHISGSDVFVSFDRKAAKLLKGTIPVLLLES